MVTIDLLGSGIDTVVGTKRPEGRRVLGPADVPLEAMNGNRTKGASPQETDAPDSKLSRRHFMGATAAVALTRIRDAGHDPSEADQWSPVDGWGYITGTFTPLSVAAGADGPLSSFRVGRDTELTDQRIEVGYGPGAVLVSFHGKNDGLSVDGGLKVSPEQAKQLGAAIYQAGWELENRPDAEADR